MLAALAIIALKVDIIKRPNGFNDRTSVLGVGPIKEKSVLLRRMFMLLGSSAAVASCAPTGSPFHGLSYSKNKARIIMGKNRVILTLPNGRTVFDSAFYKAPLLEPGPGGIMRATSSILTPTTTSNYTGNVWNNRYHFTNGSGTIGWMQNVGDGTSAIFMSPMTQPIRINGELPLLMGIKGFTAATKSTVRSVSTTLVAPGDGSGGGTATPPPQTSPTEFTTDDTISDSYANDQTFAGPINSYPEYNVDDMVEFYDEYGTPFSYSGDIAGPYGTGYFTASVSATQMTPQQSAACDAAVRSMLMDAAAAVAGSISAGAAVLASGGTAAVVGWFLVGIGVSRVLSDRANVDRICGPGSPYYNSATYNP